MPTYAPPRTPTLRTERTPAPVEWAGAAARARHGIAVGVVLALAAAMFSLRLGEPSLFIDEVYSWSVSRADLAHLFANLQTTEINPPLYYVLLHGWLQLVGSDSEIALRAPSVLAGVGLVAALYWLGGLIAGRRAALAAALLAALSPMVLVYSQQARTYVMLMLALTIAVAAAIQGARGGSRRLLALAAAAAACAVLLHYTAVFVLGPLALWLWRQPGVGLRWRIGLGAAIALPFAALAPLMLDQLGRGHQSITIVESYGMLSPFNALRISGTPFDGRTIFGLTFAREIAALVVVEGLALLAFADRFSRLRARWLIVACGTLPLIAVAVVAATGMPVALTRYTTGAAPFIIVALAAVIVRGPRAIALPLAIGALAASAVGIVSSQRRDGLYPDTRAAVSVVADGWQAGDRLVGLGYLGYRGALDYYASRLLPPTGRAVPAFTKLGDAGSSVELMDAIDAGRTLWFVSDPPLGDDEVARELELIGYHAVATRQFASNTRIELIEAEPIP